MVVSLWSVYLVVTFLQAPKFVGAKTTTEQCLKKITACQLRDDACRCTMVDGRCPCCRLCHACLGNLWDDCCGVANLCDPKPGPKPPGSDEPVLGYIDTPAPDMFWSVTDIVVRRLLPIDVYNRTDRDKIGLVEMNCTSAAYRCCMDLSECVDVCKDIGATRFRWFPECRNTPPIRCGCCECEGSGCIKEVEDGPAMCKVCDKNVSVDKMAEECKRRENAIEDDFGNHDYRGG